MSIDPQSEQLISSKDVPAEVQKWTKSKRRISHSTLHRWFMTGISGVVLSSVLIAGTRFTSKQALVRFFNDSAKAKSKRLSKSTSAGIQKKRASARARDVEELGI